MTLSLIVGWAASTAEDWLAKADLPPATRDEYAAVLSYAEAHPVDSAYHLPLSEHPLALMPMMGQAFLALLAETNEGSTSGQEYEHITAPALFTTNYYDDVLTTGIEQYLRMRTGAATERARDETRLILGPWDHGNLYSMVGQVNFGLHAYGLSGGAFVKQMHLDFFSRHLRGEDVSELPGAKYFRHRPQHLERGSGMAAADGRAGAGLPAIGRWTRRRWRVTGWCRSDPRRTSLPTSTSTTRPSRYPTFGGRFMALTGCPNGPLDQAPIERRADVLIFYSLRAARPAAPVHWNVTLQLHVAADVPEQDSSRGCARSTSGRVFNFADGIVRTIGATSPMCVPPTRPRRGATS